MFVLLPPQRQLSLPAAVIGQIATADVPRIHDVEGIDQDVDLASLGIVDDDPRVPTSDNPCNISSSGRKIDACSSA